MQFSIEDIRQQFDGATFSRGADYQRRHKVLGAGMDDGAITGSVSGSQASTYQQTIKLSARGAHTAFDGRCSCPMTRNCKHVVAVLLEVLARAPAQPQPQSEPQPQPQQPQPQQPSPQPRPAVVARWAAPMAADISHWLLSVAGAARTAQVGRGAASVTAAAGPAAAPAFRPVYVLMPGAVAGSVALLLCKGRVAADGAVRSATPVRDLYDFNHFPPAYVRGMDPRAAKLFTVLHDNDGFGAALVEPAGELGADLLRLLLERELLFWAGSGAAFRSGLRPMRAGPAREGALAWRAQEGQAGLRLAWQLDDGNVPDCVVATAPPMYVCGTLIGELRLSGGAPAMGMAQWTRLVARAPLIAPADVAALSLELAAPALRGLLPLPHQERSVTRDDIRPTAVLTLDSVERGKAARQGGGVWHDHALLSFDYDGLRATADPQERLVRPIGGGMETIVRDAGAEAAVAAELAALGFRAPQESAAPPGGMPGQVTLASEHDWLHFATHGLARLRQQGWRIDLGEHFRFDLAAIDDWYAQVGHEEEGDSPWFELELGIVVDGARVPLLPVLLQLIRQAPGDFDRAALEARGDGELLLAVLPGGARVALAWSRVKPILRTLGELYFSDRIGDALLMPALDMARLAELEAGAQWRWMGGEHLLALGRKLNAFDGVQPVAAPAGLSAHLRAYQAEGLAWMQFLREYGLAGILADDMGLGKTIQTLSHILVEKEAGRLTAPALVVAPTSLMSNWQEEAAASRPACGCCC
jgi:hypothetical protein